nr:MAG TPA: Nucleotide modification associated domain 5 [Caudoviricetes sp.]
MRLTKEMRSNLLNIIENKTKHPFKVQENSITKELQDYIYKKEPVFKEYLDLYEQQPYQRFRECMRLNNDWSTSIYLIVPTDSYLRSLIGQKQGWGTILFPVKNKNSDYAMDPDFEPIYNKLVQLAKDCEEYKDALSNLAITINNCATDKQLADMYPDFIKYFNAAGIVVQAQKQLPAKLRLPESLVKFGLVLETKEEKESKQKALEDVIKEDIEDDK